MAIRKGPDYTALKIIAYVVVSVAAAACLLPFLMLVSSSFTQESEIIKHGFSLLPLKFTLGAYEFAFRIPGRILSAYMVTVTVTAVGTFFSLFFVSMAGYVLQRRDFRYRNRISFIIYFAQLFSVGLIPQYILVTKFLGLGQGSAAEFDGSLAQGRLTYPSQAVEVQMNLIDSHDTPRFLTQVNGNVKRLKLAALFAMTYVGAPHIYYGDEIGMEGGKDPDCRRPFNWDYAKDPWRVELLDYYKKLTATRHSSAALRTGDFRTLYAQGKAYAYLRSGGGEQWLVALNAGKEPAEILVDLAGLGASLKATDVLGGTTTSWSGTAKIVLEPESGRLFQLTTPAK